jgi:translation elongation factor aEF-1 beta
VVAKFKIFPEDIEADLGELKEELGHSLPVDTSVYKYEEEPVAFGITLLIAYIVMPEEEGGKIDEVERAIKKLSGVSEVEVVMVRRV